MPPGWKAVVSREVIPQPIEQNVTGGAAHHHDSGCDSLVGVAGRSSTDAAKAVYLKASHELPPAEYGTESEGWNRITSYQPQMVAIPPTAGTGGEVGRASAAACTALLGA